MRHQEKSLTEAQKKAVAFLTRPKPDLSAWRAAREAAVKKEEEAEQDRVVANDEVGYTMLDGTIYAGISPDTHQPMYAAPADASIVLDFGAAAKYASRLEVGGKKGFRVPTQIELNLLLRNREKGALKGTFNVASRYWTSTVGILAGEAWYESFVNGLQNQSTVLKGCCLSARCVRG